VYIQDERAEREPNAPPDYSGHTYKPAAPMPEMPIEEAEQAPAQAEAQKESAPAGAFGARGGGAFHQKESGRGELFGNLGLGNLFSRVPFLSSLLPPPRGCEAEKRRHSELWDWVLLAVVALSLLNGRDDDVLPILLLLLLWD
jgi:hypothetical protein